MNKILVIAVHPDDETLGCGGTLLKLKDRGCELHWLIATMVSDEDGYSREFVATRRQEIETVSKKYSFAGVHELGLPAARIETVPVGEIVGKVASIMKKVNPDTLFLPFKEDVHSDHRIIFNAAFSCTKSFRQSSLQRIYMMETLSETEFSPAIPGQSFVPNTFVDISRYFDKKLEILQTFSSELGEHPFPRSIGNITALATYRGATSGCQYAESFMLLKDVW